MTRITYRWNWSGQKNGYSWVEASDGKGRLWIPEGGEFLGDDGLARARALALLLQGAADKPQDQRDREIGQSMIEKARGEFAPEAEIQRLEQLWGLAESEAAVSMDDVADVLADVFGPAR